MSLEQLMPYLPLILGAACALAVLLFAMLRRGGREEIPQLQESPIQLASLPQQLPAGGPVLEFYGVPVRMSAAVVAVAGRGETISDHLAREVLLSLAPRMDEVLRHHQPHIICWPNQLSAQGFRVAFFHHAALPGKHGQGTRWCSVAGKLTIEERQFLLGFVCCAESPNPLGQVTVEHEGRWLDVLRVRASQPA